MKIEIKLSEEIANRAIAFTEKCKHDIKMVTAICRVPRLSYMFQQACRKKEDKKTFEVLER